MLRLLLLSALVIGAGCSDDIGPPGSDGGTDSGSGDCNEGETRCGSRCVNTNTDARDCGGCGNACEMGSFCNMGMCDRNCSSGLMACGTSCIDISNDRNHCGGCDNPCRDDQACRGGNCACPEGNTECGGLCIDPDTDPNNCGVCDRMCDSESVCRNGLCTCPDGEREVECNDMLDDDCDGLIDCEDDDCVDRTRPCMVGGCGGVETCQADTNWGMCIGGNGIDICGDGIDQDCDGSDLVNPDMYESNDICMDCTMVTMTIDPSITINGRFDSVTDNVDCYRFIVRDDGFFETQEEIEVTLTDIPVGHDYDIYLYKDFDDCVTRSDTERSARASNADEDIEYCESPVIDDGGTFFVRVVRFAGHSCEDDYTLTFNGLRDLGVCGS